MDPYIHLKRILRRNFRRKNLIKGICIKLCTHLLPKVILVYSCAKLLLKLFDVFFEPIDFGIKVHQYLVEVCWYLFESLIPQLHLSL